MMLERMFNLNSYYKKRKEKLHEPPGSLIYIGDSLEENITVNFTGYDQENFQHLEVNSIKELRNLLENDYTVSWIHINGIHNVQAVKELGNVFNINDLILENIVNTGKRPRVSIYPDYILTIIKNITFNKIDGISTEQVSIITGQDFIITFQEKGQPLFSKIVERIKNDVGNIRYEKIDYLFYSILDYLIDNYFKCIEDFGDQIERLDGKVLSDFQNIDLKDFKFFKQSANFMQKVLWPTRDLINDIIQQIPSNDENKKLNIFFRDIYLKTFKKTPF